MAYYSQIQFAVAVEISRCQRTRRSSCAVVNCGLERAIAIAQQHRACRGEVRSAIAVEVAHRNRYRIRSRGEPERPCKAGCRTTVGQSQLVLKQTVQQNERSHRRWFCYRGFHFLVPLIGGAGLRLAQAEESDTGISRGPYMTDNRHLSHSY